MGANDSSPCRAWLLLALLTFLNVVNFVDRQLIISVQVPLKQELYLTDVQITVLSGYAFSVIYAITGLFMGTVADRWHRPRLIAVGLFVWSGMTAASGLARDFWELGLPRFFIGIGEAVLTPAAIAMLSDVFRPRQRALASGLYYLGIPIGASLSFFIASLIDPLPMWGWPGMSWRYCFFGLGITGMVLVGVLLFIQDPARGGLEDGIAACPLTPSAPCPSVGRGERSLLHMLGDVFATLRRSPALILTIVAGVLINIPVGSTWLDPSWLVQERGFTHQRAVLFIGVLFLLGGSLGNFLGGWLGDAFHKRWRSGRLLALVVIQVVITPFGIASRFLPADSWMFPVCFFLGAILVTMIYGPIYASVQELTPLHIRATMVAVLIVGLMLFGASFGGWLAAFLEKQIRTGGYTDQPLTWGIFLTGQIGLLAIPLLLWAARRYKMDLARVHNI